MPLDTVVWKLPEKHAFASHVTMKPERKRNDWARLLWTIAEYWKPPSESVARHAASLPASHFSPTQAVGPQDNG